MALNADGASCAAPQARPEWSVNTYGPSADSVAIASQVSNAFLKGGPGNDALQAWSCNNVLDGATASNFLTGGNGSDGGIDTFFIDGRGGAVTWSTIVNFHEGDQITFWGFVPNQSTQNWVDADGVQ